jgi:hypothetical protein
MGKETETIIRSYARLKAEREEKQRALEDEIQEEGSSQGQVGGEQEGGDDDQQEQMDAESPKGPEQFSRDVLEQIAGAAQSAVE